jgi:hypothetical protein
MTCKNCGTEIADKALICYRCGQATFEAQRQPVTIGEARGFLRRYYLTTLLVLVITAGGVLYARYVETPDFSRWVAGAFIVALLVVIAWRIIMRRRFARKIGR